MWQFVFSRFVACRNCLALCNVFIIFAALYARTWAQDAVGFCKLIHLFLLLPLGWFRTSIAPRNPFFLGGGQFATNECSGHLYSPRAKLMRLWVWGNHCSACIFSGSSFLTVRLTRAAGGRSAFFAPAVFLARICHPSVARNKVKRHPCP